MKITLKRERTEDGDEVIRFAGEISFAEIVRLKLDRLDRALLDSLPPGSPPADYLLALEMLFRRAREQGIA
jgi:hypothetical protein